MNKAQAIYSFWSSFELPTYDNTTVPDNAQMPYITFDFKEDCIDREVGLTGSLWYRDSSWEAITLKSDEIAQRIEEILPIKIDSGYVWIKRGSPFAQRMNDTDDGVRRILISITVEFLTAI